MRDLICDYLLLRLKLRYG